MQGSYSFNQEYRRKVSIFRSRLQHKREFILSYLNQPKRNRLHQRDYARKIYCSRHIIENTFLALKRWRVPFRYAKTLGVFIFSVFVCCIFMLF